jgi:two-component system phosphate regulon sensor histidine kinase PhoR
MVAWTVAAIAGVPSLCLAVLLATGGVTPRGGLLALGLTILAALILAMIWHADIERLARLLRDSAQDGGPDGAGHARPVLPPMARLAEAADRLARTLADHAAQVVNLLRANEAVIERLPDLLLILGRDGSVRRANAAARAAFGGDMPAVVRHPGLRQAIDQAFARPDVAHTADLSLPVPVRREVQATVLAMDPPLADGGHAVAVLSDRTRERAVERMRADFVANASHELRTPLASLIGFIDTLRGPAADDPAAQARFLGIMAEQAQRMNRLIDDLLSLSRIELTEHQAPAERVDLCDVTDRVIALFEPQVRTRGATLAVTVPRDLPKVQGDADQLEQVLQNLGTVRVSASVSGPGGRWPARPGIVLTVADDGPGIRRDHIPRLTERFYRVDKGRSRSAGGTGLGLAIVKHIVNRHRGQLLIESEEGLGCTFSVWLPQAPER